MIRAALLVAGAACGVAAPGQDDATEPARIEPIEFRSPDGSRFLLAPRDDAPPLVQWTIVTPAGPAEDPPGHPGLSRAVVRASLAGTRSRGSRGWSRERDALRRLDALEQEAAAATDPTEDLAQRLAEARTAARQLGDPTAWRSELAAAPAVDIELVETPRASILTLTTTPGALPLVARLLWDRREHAALRGLRGAYAACRAELDEVQRSDAQRSLRRDLLDLAFNDDTGSPAPTDQPADFTRDDALLLWRELAQPRRSAHVLTGGFQGAEVRALLDAAFATTSLPTDAAPAPPQADTVTSRSARSATGTFGHAAAVGLVEPTTGVPPGQLTVLGHWLAAGDHAALTRALANTDYPDARVHYAFPVPENAAPALLVVAFHAGALPADAEPPDPATALDAAMTEVLAEPPAAYELRAAYHARRLARAAALADPTRLALDLARRWGVGGRRPDTLLAPLTELDPDAVQELLRSLWHDGPRVIVERIPER